jgi:hypothetical protein
MEKSIYKLKFYGEDYELLGVYSHYANNETLAVVLVDKDTFEPFADITVNLSNSLATKTLAYVDTNNNEWAEKFLTDNKIAKPVGEYGFNGRIFGSSGFCVYPLYEFDLTKLMSEEEFEKLGGNENE